MCSKRNFRAAAAVIILVAAALVLVSVFRAGSYLTLRDADSGRVYARYRVSDGDEFSVGFVHSVNKSPVVDFYEIHDQNIYVVKTVYYGFGAGVETELGTGETLTYGADGSMIVSGFDREMTELRYFVGTVSDHTLTIGAQSISLRDLCGRNSPVAFSCEYRLL